MPDTSDAIRLSGEENEPPAVVFDSQALPGALVSWAWCQLSALDGLLCAGLEDRSDDDDAVVAVAAHTILVPVMSALVFAEKRSHELQRIAEAPAVRAKEKGRASGGRTRTKQG
jgi:hypothetical protein